MIHPCPLASSGLVVELKDMTRGFEWPLWVSIRFLSSQSFSMMMKTSYFGYAMYRLFLANIQPASDPLSSIMGDITLTIVRME